MGREGPEAVAKEDPPEGISSERDPRHSIAAQRHGSAWTSSVSDVYDTYLTSMIITALIFSLGLTAANEQ
jgi:hypothetical protein